MRAHREAKSIGAERTFEADLTTRDDLHAALGRVADAAWARVDRSGARGKTVTLKIRYADFRTFTRARSTPQPVTSQADFLHIGSELLDAQLPVADGVRLLGLTLSGIIRDGSKTEEAQPSLPL